MVPEQLFTLSTKLSRISLQLPVNIFDIPSTSFINAYRAYSAHPHILTAFSIFKQQPRTTQHSDSNNIA